PHRAGPGPAAHPGAAPAGRGGAGVLHLSRTRPSARQHPPAREPDRAPARPRPYRNRTGGVRDDEDATPEPAAGRGDGRRAAGGPAGPGQLARTPTLAGWHDGVEHYLTSFTYAGGGARFGSIVPLPGIPSDVRKGGEWTLQRLVRETHPQPGAFRTAGAVPDAGKAARELRAAK